MKYLFLIGIITAAFSCPAQKSDSLAALRLYLTVCNSYKRVPAQVDIDIRNSCNYFLEPGDTTHATARFSLRSDGTYMGFGEVEQIADDSLLLLVNKRLKKMLLYGHHRSVSEQLLANMGIRYPDSSLTRMAAKYKVEMMISKGDSAGIRVTGRVMLKYGDFPREDVTVRYNPSTLDPYEVRQVKRELVPLTVDQYHELATRPDEDRTRLIRTDSSFYLVRELVTVYRYDHIAHQQDAALPARVSDRVRKDDQGNFTPVDSYEGYTVKCER